MTIDKNLEIIFDYIFIKKNKLRAKTLAEAILACYLVAQDTAPKDDDRKRGTKAINQYIKLRSKPKIKNCLRDIKKFIDLGDFEYAINMFKDLINLPEVQDYVLKEKLTRQSDSTKSNKITDKLSPIVQEKFLQYDSKHPGIIKSKRIREKINVHEKDKSPLIKNEDIANSKKIEIVTTTELTPDEVIKKCQSDDSQKYSEKRESKQSNKKTNIPEEKKIFSIKSTKTDTQTSEQPHSTQNPAQTDSNEKNLNQDPAQIETIEENIINLKPVFEYIFLRKGKLRAKTPEEAVLACYLVVQKAALKDK